MIATLEKWLQSNDHTDKIPKSILNPKQLLLDLRGLLQKEPTPPPIDPEPWVKVIQENRQKNLSVDTSALLELFAHQKKAAQVVQTKSEPAPPTKIRITTPTPIHPPPPSVVVPIVTAPVPPPVTLPVETKPVVSPNPPPPAPIRMQTVKPKDSVRQRLAKKLGVKLKKSIY